MGDQRDQRGQRESLVDERVRVWWDGDEQWYHGRVVEWSCLKQDGRGMHRVKYDDGELRWEFLDGPNVPVWWEKEIPARPAAEEAAAAVVAAEAAAAVVAEAAAEAEAAAVDLPAAPQREPLAVIDLDELVSQRRRLPPQRFQPRASFAQDPGRMRRKPSSLQPCVPQQGPPVRIKHEDAENGLIRCPSCKSALQVGTRGCSTQVCHRTDHPGGGWFYFCFHCRADLGEGRHCNKCPLDNNAETRQRVKNRDNILARRNPIVL